MLNVSVWETWFLVGYPEQLLVKDLDFYLVLADVVSAAYLLLSSWQLACLLCYVLQRGLCGAQCAIKCLLQWSPKPSSLSCYQSSVAQCLLMAKSSLLVWNTDRFVLGFDDPAVNPAEVWPQWSCPACSCWAEVGPPGAMQCLCSMKQGSSHWFEPF